MTLAQGAVLAAAREAVAAASAVCRAVAARRDQIRTLVKDDRSPVTVADFASQAVATRVLRDRLGSLPVIAEEHADVLRGAAPGYREAVVEAVRVAWPGAQLDDVLQVLDEGEAPTAAGFWTLDPIDGTKGFLRGQQYCVSLAWIEGGAPQVGVLGCPNLPFDGRAAVDVADATGSSYFAVRGGGAHGTVGTEPGAPSAPVQVSRRDGPLVLCAPLEKDHADAGPTDALAEALGATGPPVRLDSQCKYAVVARGQADAYLRLPRTRDHVERIWDHAAGALLAAEAGCRVTDVAGQPLDFSRGAGLTANHGILCGQPQAHARVLAALARRISTVSERE